MKVKKEELVSFFLLIFASFLWGISFVFQSMASNHLGTFSINTFRSLIAALFLLPIALYSIYKSRKENKPVNYKISIIGGVFAGFFLALASIFQQLGISTTSTSKSGFITAFYIILVPLLSIFFKKKCGNNVYIAIIIALVGLGLLTLNSSFRLEIGDIYLFIGSIFFSLQILTIDQSSNKANIFLLMLIQMTISGVVTAPFIVLETISFEAIYNALLPILFLGIASNGVAYTIQVITQKVLNPTVASLLMSLESVFASLTGVIIYTFYEFSDVPQYLNLQQTFGCIVMFIAVTISILPSPRFTIAYWKNQKKKNTKNLKDD